MVDRLRIITTATSDVKYENSPKLHTRITLVKNVMNKLCREISRRSDRIPPDILTIGDYPSKSSIQKVISIVFPNFSNKFPKSS
jgi:hypothetical protein